MGASYCGSMQVMLIRQIQEEVGQRPCYATAERERCAKSDCCWRFDCYCDDEAFPPDSAGSSGPSRASRVPSEFLSS